ncbi:MAG TPA: zf-HC2 domain-containing protein [Bryobacteraceae bacterium]|nr:zf-HC2 domain-containing protein [Bryobacteraceae bacterium]
MDHSEAVSGHAVERYLLGEMSEPEAEAFEQHFFECTACSEDLSSGALLVENLRALPVRADARQPAAPEKDRAAKPERTRRFAPWWKQPLFAAPAFAAVVLAFVTGYQARELARANRPESLLVYDLKSARGPFNQVRVPAGATHFALSVDLLEDSSPRYRCDFEDSAGRVRFSVDHAAPPQGEPLSVLVPAGVMGPGEYTLIVRGLEGSQAGADLARYHFEVVK